MNQIFGIVLGLCCLIGTTTYARSSAFDSWMTSEEALSWRQLEAQVSPPDALPGVVIASPTRRDPFYYKHWVRDSALVMDVWVRRFANETHPIRLAAQRKQIVDFLALSRRLQQTTNPSGSFANGGLGEPLFEVDGSPMWSSWGRPQTDGPALRAITLIHFAETLLARGESNFVRENLYDPSSLVDSALKTDLDYVVAHGEDSAFDIWEETRGHHFYNRMVQRKALMLGARLARRLGDATRAEVYRERALHIATELPAHWDATRGYLVETLDWADGNADKKTNLDSAILLAVLHGGTGDQFFGVTDDRVIATAAHLWQTFRDLYAINRVTTSPNGLAMAPAIGRYSEDRYEGAVNNTEGSPWALLNFTFAEYCDRVAANLVRRGGVSVSSTNEAFLRLVAPEQTLTVGERIHAGDPRFEKLIEGVRARSDEFFERVRAVAGDGHLNEQFNRHTGVMQSAADLSWSYAAFLSAKDERDRSRLKSFRRRAGSAIALREGRPGEAVPSARASSR